MFKLNCKFFIDLTTINRTKIYKLQISKRAKHITYSSNKLEIKQ